MPEWFTTLGYVLLTALLIGFLLCTMLVMVVVGIRVVADLAEERRELRKKREREG